MRMDAVHSVAMAAPNRPLRALFIYWFVGKDRVTPYHAERIFWTMKDRVLENRNHRWAYILVFSPVRAEQTSEAVERGQTAAMELLAQFVEQLSPALRPLPNS